jgi:hypothetical protein
MKCVGQSSDLAALRLDERHHVLAVGAKRLVGGPAQSHMEGRPILGIVHRVPCEHELDPPPNLRLLGELEKELQSAFIDELPAEVEKQAFALDRKTIEPLRIVLE